MAFDKRQAWADKLARSILETVSGKLRDSLLLSCGNDPMIAAYAYVHIALCHVEGLTAQEILSQLYEWQPDVDWSNIALQSISDYRASGLTPPLSDDLLLTWVSLGQLSRARIATIRLPEPYEYLVVIKDGGRLSLGSSEDQPPSLEPDMGPILEPIMSIGSWQPPPGSTYRLDAPHLEPYRRAIFELDYVPGVDDRAKVEMAKGMLAALKSWLTPLEYVALLPEPADRLLLDEAVRTSRGIYVLPLFMVGEWADLYPGEDEPRVPRWVYDFVVTGGARSATYTTGLLHGWILVSEGSWDIDRISRLLVEVERVGISEEPNHVDLSILLPAFADDPNPLAMDFHYELTDPDGLRGIFVLAATGCVKLDLYGLSDGSLAFLGSRSVNLADELTARLVELSLRAIRDVLDSRPGRLFSANLERLAREVEADNRFAASEISRHELLWHVSLLADRGTLPQADRDVLEAARLAHLAAESNHAKLQLAGAHPRTDDSVDRRRAEFEELLAKDGNRWIAANPPLSTLRPGQAFLHMEHRDGGVDWVAAGVNADGSWYHWTPQEPGEAIESALREFFRSRHGRVSIHARAAALDQLIHVLDESVAEIAGHLDDLGVTEIIASPGAQLDGTDTSTEPWISRTSCELRSISQVPRCYF